MSVQAAEKNSLDRERGRGQTKHRTGRVKVDEGGIGWKFLFCPCYVFLFFLHFVLSLFMHFSYPFHLSRFFYLVLPLLRLFVTFSTYPVSTFTFSRYLFLPFCHRVFKRCVSNMSIRGSFITCKRFPKTRGQGCRLRATESAPAANKGVSAIEITEVVTWKTRVWRHAAHFILPTQHATRIVAWTQDGQTSFVSFLMFQLLPSDKVG